ncbi:MAG: glutamine amidotransferase, partial [Phycisphaerales bacterium]|nr:glutamine amidotransferase [Phycisphaerales bacterium]
MSLLFEHPGWLLLLLLLVPVWLLAWATRGVHAPLKSGLILGLRSLLVAILAVAMAEPIWEQEGEGVTVAVVLDRSRSVPPALQERAVQFLQDAAQGMGRRAEDQIAVVHVASDAVPSAMPDTGSIIDLSAEPADLSETNLARGIELAKGLLPNETANRILLVSDGNQTRGSLLAAADLAEHSGIPIDVLPIEYRNEREVLVDRLVAPARARRGQAIEITAVLQSQGSATGKLFLRRNGSVLDLNGAEAGMGLPLALEGGTHVERLTVGGDRVGPQQFEVIFEADAPSMDSMTQNNSAAAVTFISGQGQVLVVAEQAMEVQSLLSSLGTSGLDIVVREPDSMGAGLVDLLAYDAVLLANVPRWLLTEQQVAALRAYVHDAGGGLVMTGGPRAFGAGGWIDSPVAEVLPLRLDPPANRQILRGALALIMHSCEMPQGNYWGQKTAESAIEALSRLDMVGIVEYVSGKGTEWALPMQEVGDKSQAFAATRQLQYGDMPDFAPSMRMALTGLEDVDAGHRHAIIISDGDPQPPPQPLLQGYVDANASISTVLVAPHTPTAASTMQAIAQITGGEFYQVTDPNELPQIFIKEAQMVVRSLIQEGRFEPARISAMPGPVAGISSVPPIDGFVLTAPREGLAQIAFGVPTSEGVDPLYAWWNHGLGRSVAFTGDLSGRWGSNWSSWSGFGTFWSQTLRWVMRPATPSDFTLSTRESEDEVVVELEALDTDASFLNFLQTRASTIGPEGDVTPLTLQQVGPGRYQGRFSPKATGAHVVNVHLTAPDS